MEKYALPNGLNVKDVSWKALVDMLSDELLSFEGKRGELSEAIDEKTREKITIQRELHVTRIALAHKLEEASEQGFADTKFFMHLVKLLERSEQLAELYELELGSWLRFLHVLKEKAKGERVVIYGKEGIREKELSRGLACAEKRIATEEILKISKKGKEKKGARKKAKKSTGRKRGRP
ncbi:MAG: hypothetical protein ABIH99_02600 [Candidatus Micrarchaeota archaeon]